MATIFDLLVSIGVRTDNLASGLRSAANQVRQTGSEIQAAGVGMGGAFNPLNTALQSATIGITEMRQQAGALTGIATGITALFAAPAAALTSSASEYTKFDAALTKSLAIQEDVSESMRGKLSQAAIDLSKTISVTATAAASSYYFLASAGQNVEQQIASLPIVANFAKAGLVSMNDSAAILTRSQYALGLASKDAATNTANLAMIADVLVKADTLALGKTQEFAAALTNKGATAMKTFGISLLDGISILASFSQAGIRGAQAGTYFEMAVRQLTAAPIGKHAAEWDRLGVSVYDANGKFKSIIGIISDLQKALSGMTDEEKKAELGALGIQSRAQFALLPLLGLTQQTAQLRAEFENFGGTAKRVADNQMQGFAEQMSILWNRLTAVRLVVGGALVPGLRELQAGLDPLLKHVEALAASFQTLPKWLQTTAVGLAALVTAGGLATAALLYLGSGALSFAANLAALGGGTAVLATLSSVAAGAVPILIGLGGAFAVFEQLKQISADITAIIGPLQDWKTLWAEVPLLISAAKGAFDSLFPPVETLSGAFIIAGGNLNELGTVTKNAGLTLWAFKAALDGIFPSFTELKNILAPVGSGFSFLYEQIKPEHWYEAIPGIGTLVFALDKLALAAQIARGHFYDLIQAGSGLIEKTQNLMHTQADLAGGFSKSSGSAKEFLGHLDDVIAGERNAAAATGAHASAQDRLNASMSAKKFSVSELEALVRLQTATREAAESAKGFPMVMDAMAIGADFAQRNISVLNLQLKELPGYLQKVSMDALTHDQIIQKLGIDSSDSLRAEANRLYDLVTALQRVGATDDEIARASAKWAEAEAKADGMVKQTTVSVTQQRSVWTQLGTSITQVFTQNLGRSITDAIAGIHRFGDSVVKMGEQVLDVILNTIIAKGTQKLLNSLADVSGMIGKIAGAFGGVASIPIDRTLAGSSAAAATTAAQGGYTPGFNGTLPPVGGAASSGSGAASSAAGSLTSTLGTVFAGITAGATVLSGIVSGFQQAHMESDLTKIEASTRFAWLSLGGEGNSIVSNTLHTMYSTSFMADRLVEISNKLQDLVGGTLITMDATLTRISSKIGASSLTPAAAGGGDVYQIYFQNVDLSDEPDIEEIGKGLVKVLRQRGYIKPS